MSGCPFKNMTNMTRRGFFKALGGAGLVAAGATMGPQAAHLLGGSAHADTPQAGGEDKTFAAVDSLYGEHQAGIISPPQLNSYFASFDLVTEKREDIARMLKAWTEAVELMAEGKPAGSVKGETDKPAPDSGDTVNLSGSRLTVTFGFGAGLFIKDGKDRYGLAAKRPAALVDMPKFPGDQLVEARTGGDISVQACAESPQVAFHAVRQLARLAAGIAEIRWVQTGFVAIPGHFVTPRNLMGFKDGTQYPADKNKYVWVGEEGGDWMRGGSYVVVRRIRIALEHWDNTSTEFQEKVIGRYKDSGAGLGSKYEYDALDLQAVDKDGNFIIPDNAHVRLAHSTNNNGASIFRRAYSYNDGANMVAERWPPWRQGLEYDAGLFFVCYQRDPSTGFIPIFTSMSRLDALHQFTTHTGGGLFAIPGGIRKGEYVGQRLFESV